MDSDLPTPLHIIQDSRYAKQDGCELGDICLCSSGNIAVSGHHRDHTYVCIYGSTVDNSDSRDKPTLLYHKQFTDKLSWRRRCISFIKPNSTEIVTCQHDEVQVIDYNRDVVLRSRKVNGRTTCLSVSESQIFIGLLSGIVNIYDNDLNRIKSIRLKGIRYDCPRDIAAAADRLYVCTADDYRAIVYSQDSGSILTEYTTGQDRSEALSMGVNIQHQIVAVLWDTKQVAVYSINSNNCLIVFNVEFGVSRIRISDQGRVVTGNTATGEVKIYMLHSFVTYNTLKKWWQAVLQKNDCKRLMNHFHLPKDQKDSILMTETPTNDLLLALEERDIIYQSNVSRLIDAFVALQLNETYYKAAKIYQENASATSYDRFLVTLSTHLTASLAKDLCSHFEIPDNKKSNITSNQNPGLSLLLALDKMGIINQSRVLTLEQPFTNLRLVQAVAKIQEYQSLIEDDRNLFQHTTGLTKEEKRNLFMKLLQKKIMSWYEAMTPVPWKKSCQWKSSELFVGSGLILTNSKNGRNLLNVDEKCKLNYTEIFTHSSLEEETRIIIEGEPGSGKTMLSSQLAHDWSQGKISDINILILLPLKFVERKTLVEATKEYYLTEYKGLSLVDIEDVIIGEGVKCCFLLDGLEEYNGQDETSAEEMSEVMKVMTKVKYPNSKVILTSRSDYTQDLPPYPMLKLGTFGEVQRQIYIEKVFSDDFEKQMKVKNAIEDTPFILDLCSVPLLFVLAVHNIGSIVNMQDVWQDRVSPFIGLVVETLCPREKREDRVGVTQRCGCRYAHYDEDLNVFWNDEDEDIWGDHGDFNDFWDSSDSDSELDPFETYQNRSQGISLEMLAFNGLCRGKQQLSWQKKFVEENVRNMEKYLDSGILVVEDAVNVGMDIARTAKENADTEQVKEVWGKVNENIPRERDSDSGRAVITQKDNVDPAFNKELQKDNVDPAFNKEWERSVKERSDALKNTKHKDRSNYDKPTIREESEPGEYLKAPLTVQHVSLQVKFLHKVLQEWFAARYLANICWKYGELALPNKYKFFREHLQQINPADLHYVLRFTCALCPPSCHLILNYLLSDFRNEEGKIPGHIMNCICLCLAEYDGYKGHYIKDVISEVCKADITIHSEDSRLIQRTKVSMLQFAANCGFPVSRLQLLDVVVRAAEDELTFTSGATLQTLHTLHEIEISRWDYALKEEDYANIVKFINNSTSIKKAVLYFPSQPPVLEPETLKDVAAKQITVAWHIGQVIQTLDPSKGIWMVQLREHYNQVTASSVEPCQDDFMSYEHLMMSLPGTSSAPFGKWPTKRPLSKMSHSDMKLDIAAKRLKMNWNLKIKSEKEYKKEEVLDLSEDSILMNWNLKLKSEKEYKKEEEGRSTSYVEEKFVEETPSQGRAQVLIKEETAESDFEQKHWTVSPSGAHEQSQDTDRYPSLTAQAIITKEGGVLEIPNSGVFLIVPPSSIPFDREKCTVQMKIISREMEEDQEVSFSSNSSAIVELLPDKLMLKRPVRLILPHCLALQDGKERTARIFVSHHTKGNPPRWEEQTHLSYYLEDTTCTILLDSFCWVKYSIDDTIVTARKLVVYAAVRKLLSQAKVATIVVGYYSDIPGKGSEFLQRNPDLIVCNKKTFLFRKLESFPLQFGFAEIFPSGWHLYEETPEPKVVPYEHVASLSKEHKFTYILERKETVAGNPFCVITVSQEGQIPVQLAVYPQATDMDSSLARAVYMDSHQGQALLNKGVIVNEVGGTLEIPDTGVLLEIPPAAFPADIDHHDILMRIIPSRSIQDEVVTFSSNSCVAVELLPDDLKLQRPVKLKLPHCLELKKHGNHYIRIFTKHQNEDSHSKWEEKTHLKYRLEDSACIIWMDKLCCIKYSVSNDIVIGKKIVLYTAARKNIQKEFADVEIGYYPDMPGGGELLRLNPNLIMDFTNILYFKEKHNCPLQLSLDSIVPSRWERCFPEQRSQEIPFRIIAWSIEHSHLYIIQKKDKKAPNALCKFTAAQDDGDIPVELVVEPCTQVSSLPGSEGQASGHIFQDHGKKLETDSENLTMKLLSRKLRTEWKDVCRSLGVTEGELYREEENNKGNIKEAIYKCLLFWKQNKADEATFETLRKALAENGRSDLAKDIEKYEELFPKQNTAS